jgi:hypothetical protein
MRLISNRVHKNHKFINFSFPSVVYVAFLFVLPVPELPIHLCVSVCVYVYLHQHTFHSHLVRAAKAYRKKNTIIKKSIYKLSFFPSSIDRSCNNIRDVKTFPFSFIPEHPLQSNDHVCVYVCVLLLGARYTLTDCCQAVGGGGGFLTAQQSG